MPLFSSQEIQLVRSFMQLGVGRDESIVRLVHQQWDLQEAAIMWVAETDRTSVDPESVVELSGVVAAEPEPESREPGADGGAGYVILRASSRHRAFIGYHEVTWEQLELRLGITRGALAGALSQHGIYLRRVLSHEEALRYWQDEGRGGALPRHRGP